MINGLTDNSRNSVALDHAEFGLCVDEYAALLAPYSTSQPLQGDIDRPLALSTWQTDDCFFIYGEPNPMLVQRNSREIQNTAHLLEVMRFISGTERGYSNDNIIDHRPGPIYIMDQQYPLHALLSGGQTQQIHVTKDVLGLHADQLATERVIEKTTSRGVLLHDCMNEIFQSCQRNTHSIPAALLDRFIALLKVNLGVHPERGDVRVQLGAAIFEQICRFIEHNLGDFELSTGTILRAFGVSRASLYRMFEPYGGVRNYITQRRALRAAIDIARLPRKRGKIRAASERWGFSTQPNFNRTIKRVFGTNPGALASRPPKRSADFDDGERYMLRFAERTVAA